MKHLKILLVGAGLLAASTGLASAQSYNMTASIMIAKSCTLPTSGSFNLAFPNSGGLQGQTITSTVNLPFNVNCTAGTVYNVKLNGGSNFDTVTSFRRLKDSASPANFIPYEMFRTTTYGAGDAWTKDQDFAYTGNGATQVLPINGVIRNFTGSVTAGTYTDTVSITITVQ
jgi:spore coat protein U-like protein